MAGPPSGSKCCNKAFSERLNRLENPVGSSWYQPVVQALVVLARLCNFCSLMHHTIRIGITVIQHKFHIQAFCDWFEHYEILRGSPHPYNFYGAPDQNFEVL
jgi:hypothetical protein